MSPRRLGVVAAISTVVLFGGLITAIGVAAGTGGGRRPVFQGGGSNPLTHRPDDVDQLDLFDTPEAFHAGTFQHAGIVPSGGPPRIVLEDRREKSFPRRGVWTSAVREVPFPIYELIPSYNAHCPADGGVRLQARVRVDGEWSPWLYFGRWGRSVVADRREDRPVTEFESGKVAIDTLVLRKPADAYQVRVVLQSLSPDRAAPGPTVRRVAAVASGPMKDPERRRQWLAPPAYTGRWDRSLAVPFIPQGDAPSAVIGEVCSPTSVTMVCHFLGARGAGLIANAMTIYDEETGIFGNWNRAVQRAGELGMDAWIARFRTWDQVKAQIAAGVPVIASIKFEKGAMPSNPIYQDTDGHLIVIRGFTPDGDVIVNDPASREKGNGVVYKSQELGTAWFGAGGVAYIIRPPAFTSDYTSGIGPGGE
jgi:hypothetical protein